ncbi:MAG: M36 family metallopeptidase, partial [Mycobacteriales bacterium]
LKTVRLDYTTPSTGLAGDWARVAFPLGYSGSSLDYVRSDPRFVGVMAYAHVDRYQRWLRSLGITNVNAEPQSLIALNTGDDNSQYVVGSDVIVFGGGGVPDAEDAEVILHEYGHAIQDDQMPGISGAGETGAMGEGFGDFNGANYFALVSRGFGDLCIADWDATSYATSNPPCLRRLDSKKRWPKDRAGEVHTDGELWSAFLWRLRSHLGSDPRSRSSNAIRLVLSAQELTSPTGSFGASVAALRTAARALHRNDWATWVDREARTTGFPLNP